MEPIRNLFDAAHGSRTWGMLPSQSPRCIHLVMTFPTENNGQLRDVPSGYLT